jgi:hypothetical protein
MRPEIVQLVSKGPLPSLSSSITMIEGWHEALEKIKPPLSDEEAAALIGLFPAREDERYGLAWTLVHPVETTPNWPLREYLKDRDNPWIAHLRQACRMQ